MIFHCFVHTLIAIIPRLVHGSFPMFVLAIDTQSREFIVRAESWQLPVNGVLPWRRCAGDMQPAGQCLRARCELDGIRFDPN
jgi:hypothetical protein